MFSRKCGSHFDSEVFPPKSNEKRVLSIFALVFYFLPVKEHSRQFAFKSHKMIKSYMGPICATVH